MNLCPLKSLLGLGIVVMMAAGYQQMVRYDAMVLSEHLKG